MRPHVPCVEPNHENETDFGGPIFDEKDNGIYFLAPIDRFSDTALHLFVTKLMDRIFQLFLGMYIENHGIPRSIRLDQAKFLVCNQVKNFCNKKNIEINETPVNLHRAIGLVERLIQTLKSRIACIKEEKLAHNAFHVMYALKIIIHQLRIFKQKKQRSHPSKHILAQNLIPR